MLCHWRVCLNLDVSLLQKGVTALYFASQCGHIKVVKVLLEHGAQVDLPTDVSHMFLIRWPFYLLCDSYSFVMSLNVWVWSACRVMMGLSPCCIMSSIYNGAPALIIVSWGIQ